MSSTPSPDVTDWLRMRQLSSVSMTWNPEKGCRVIATRNGEVVQVTGQTLRSTLAAAVRALDLPPEPAQAARGEVKLGRGSGEGLARVAAARREARKK